MEQPIKQSEENKMKNFYEIKNIYTGKVINIVVGGAKEKTNARIAYSADFEIKKVSKAKVEQDAANNGETLQEYIAGF